MDRGSRWDLVHCMQILFRHWLRESLSLLPTWLIQCYYQESISVSSVNAIMCMKVTCLGNLGGEPDELCFPQPLTVSNSLCFVLFVTCCQCTSTSPSNQTNKRKKKLKLSREPSGAQIPHRTTMEMFILTVYMICLYSSCQTNRNRG